MYALITIIGLCVALISGCDKESETSKQVNVVFRMDDYSAKSPTDIEEKIIDTFSNNGATITFGVIPFVCLGPALDASPQVLLPIPSEKCDILREGFKAGALEIALHGYSHQTIYDNRNSEFQGLDFESQLERLGNGKKFLEEMTGAPVTTFVPPWNKYDINTLRALEKLGFSTVSAGMDGVVIKDTKLNFLPATAELFQVRDAVKTARISSDKQPVIVVLFHAYDFKEVDEKSGTITYQDFSGLLSWLKKQEDVRLLSIHQANDIIKNLDSDRLLSNKRHYSLANFLPSLLISKNPVTLYPESQIFSDVLIKVSLLYIILAGIGMIIGMVTSKTVFLKNTTFMTVSAIGSMALLVFLIVCLFSGVLASPKRIVIGSVAFGAGIGICLAIMLKRKTNKSGIGSF